MSTVKEITQEIINSFEKDWDKKKLLFDIGPTHRGGWFFLSTYKEVDVFEDRRRNFTNLHIMLLCNNKQARKNVEDSLNKTATDGKKYKFKVYKGISSSYLCLREYQ